MSKFNVAGARPAGNSPIYTEAAPSGQTHQGGPGFARDTRSELFLLAVTNMVGEKTFYETAGARDDRYETLVRKAAVEDPAWTAAFLRWLRGPEANMRSASLVGAAEFVAARLRVNRIRNGQPPLPDSPVRSRSVVSSVLQRADEPGEMLAYWTSRYGRAIPKPIKRGVADAVQRLYSERSLLKYDTDSHGFRFGDVIDLAHPEPRDAAQGDLYRHALDRRHNRDNPIPVRLTTLLNRARLMATPVEARRELLKTPSALASAAMTWEALAGWLQGPMNREAWEAVIPSMGYMALLRNLRNFDQAGVSDDIATQVAAKLANPAEVARSRQLPMRFLSAYRAAPSLRWSWPLERALDASLANIPELGGRTLILVDTSSSMEYPLSARSDLKRWDAAVVFGLALAKRCEHAEVVSYSSNQALLLGSTWLARTKVWNWLPGESVLRSVTRWQAEGYFLGGGTDTVGAVRDHFRPGLYDRVVLLTDEQNGYRGDVFDVVPLTVPTYTWNLAGYQYGHAPSGTRNRHTFGGLTDAGFRMIPLLEAGQNASWPFEVAA